MLQSVAPSHSDVKEIQHKGNFFSLQLNEKEWEFISKSAVSSNSIFSNFIHLNVEESDLGAMLIVGTAMDTALSRRCDDLARAVTRLKTGLDRRTRRTSFSASKLMHTL